MTPVGELVVHLAWDGACVREARVRSERPRASRVLVGRRAEEAPALAGQLYAICARSQAVAAAAAVRSARRGEDAGRSPAAEIRVCAETVHEHLWRLFIDWPRLAGLVPRGDAMGAARRVLNPLLEGDTGARARAAAALAELTAREVYGCTPAAWFAISGLDELTAWSRDAATPAAALYTGLFREAPPAYAIPLLPAPDEAMLRAGVVAALEAEPDYELAPHWRGQARETGPLARMVRHPAVAAVLAARGAGVHARAVARLAELAEAIERLAGRAPARARHGGFAIGEGAGVGWVETARGLLVHRAALAGDRIADYRVVAPTEWNFHPAGAFAHGALAIEAASEAELDRRARWLAASLDPCVALRLEIGHA
jgi:uptake hydrogenase large subunit